MNSEAIVCLETILLPTTMSPAERLARVRAVRATSSGKTFNHRDVDAFKREGRS